MKKILIIYGQVIVGELLAEELAADGYLILPIGRPALTREAISILRPDLVLLDLRINENDRMHVFAEVDKDPYLQILTFAAFDGDEEDGYPPLGHAPFTRSFHFNGLRKKVAEVLQRKPVNAANPKAGAYAGNRKGGDTNGL